MPEVALKQVFYCFEASSLILALIGTATLMTGLNLPHEEIGRTIFQTFPLTVAMNGTFNEQVQIVDGQHCEIRAVPVSGGQHIDMLETYLSTAPSGSPLNDTYASYIRTYSDEAFFYNLKPGSYYVIARFNLTNGLSENKLDLRISVTQSFLRPDPYRLPSIALYFASFACAVISGASLTVIRRRSPKTEIGLKRGSVIAFFAVLVAFISTGLPWYSWSYNGEFPQTYSLQDLYEYGLSGFIPAVGKAWFIQAAPILLIVGAFLGIAGVAYMNIYKGKAPNIIVGVSGIVIVLSPIIFASGLTSLGIPLYGQGGASPYSITAFLSYGFFFAVIAGFVTLTSSILTPISRREDANKNNEASNRNMLQ
jgi:hypothetical protein